MVIRWTRAVVALALALVAVGCDPEQATIEDACANLCACDGAALPSLLRSCTADCVERIGGVAVPQDAIDCYAAAACSDLKLDDDVCTLDEGDER